MKTLLVSEIFPPRHGGSGRWFAELYSRLPRSDYLIAAGATAGDRDADRVLADRLSITRVPLSSPSWGLRSMTGLRYYYRTHRALAALIRSEGISTVHCGRCLPEGVMGWMLKRRFQLPYLCFVHGEDIQTAAESRELSWIIRRVFDNASLLIANSENTASLLYRDWHLSQEKVHVLHPGIDAERFKPAPADPAFLERMGWQGRTVILTVGRLQRRKGQDMLIRALPAIRAAIPDVLYAIVGDGDELPTLKRLVEEHGLGDCVSFLGEIDDTSMVKCYQHCTLFALPNRAEGSDIEGFGMVLAEAQACGRPVLAGDSGGTRETMSVGESGIIADCTAPEPLANAVIDLLGRGAAQLATMGERGRRHVTDHLEWSAHVARASALFEAA